MRCTLLLALVSLAAVHAFDALIPTIEETQQTLTQALSRVSSLSGPEAAKQYHEVLSAEEILIKMSAQIQTDQASDSGVISAQEESLEKDKIKLTYAFGNYTQKRAQQQGVVDNFQAQINLLNKTIEGNTAMARTLSGSIANTTLQCQALQTAHASMTDSSTADSASISKVLATLATVECDGLNAFVQKLALPTQTSFLEVFEVDQALCGCKQEGHVWLTNGCDCEDQPAESEWTCDVRKENIAKMLRRLLEHVAESAGQETKLFEANYNSCLEDIKLTNAKAKALSQIISELTKNMTLLELRIREANMEIHDTDTELTSTQDALAAVVIRQQTVFSKFVQRSNLRTQQIKLIQKILDSLNVLTHSNYAPLHLDLRTQCPTLCSNNGFCLEGVCKCNDGWLGQSCDVKVSDAKCIFQADSPLCKFQSECYTSGIQTPPSSPCAKEICEYCSNSVLGSRDPACILPQVALLCAQREKTLGCDTVTCKATNTTTSPTSSVCGPHRKPRSVFQGCCFNPVLDCEDVCASVVCDTKAPQCNSGLVVRYPFRDCCFNPLTDCADQCAVAQCSSEAPVCPLGYKVHQPFVGCCFNSSVDCEHECASVVCPEDSLPADSCRAKGLRWLGTTAGCCFDASTDCSAGDDKNQQFERQALLALFDSTKGTLWNRQEGSSKWGADTWICFWNGVECSGKAGDMHVTAIQLQNNGLSGVLPSEIGLLRHLAVLDLSDNHIEGAIPRAIGNMTHLQSLKLRNNMLTGSIPDEIHLAPLLELVDVGGNFLSGKVPETVVSVEGGSFTCAGNCFCSQCLPMRTPTDTNNPTHKSCPPCA